MSRESLALGRTVSLPEPARHDKTADADRLKEGLARRGLHAPAMPIEILQRLPGELRKNNFTLNAVLGYGEQGHRMLDLNARAIYGIALDMGTTTIEGALYDLQDKQLLFASAIENPQIVFGADVLTRAQEAMSGKGKRLVHALRDGVNSVIGALCERTGIDARHIYALSVAGNTIMSHFFLGLDVKHIPVKPHTPAVGEAVVCSARAVGISVNPHAVVYVFPNAGSYVGGDIISGILSAEIHKQADPVLFMDVGTNVEITIGCRDWIMVGAGAAGPALEGGIADIGKKAGKGTISRVSIDRKTKEARLTVISGGEPEGICGTGLIDLVSELYDAGIIDRAGRFAAGAKGVVMSDGEPAYEVYRSGEHALLFTERELRNFLRSKAGMFAFLRVFLRAVGLNMGDMQRIYVSGALGCGMNVDSAVHIGMLPDIRRDRIVPLGNSSLKGASMLLIDSSLVGEAEAIRSLITYREMSEETELLNELQGALFIPHTDPAKLKA